MMNTEHERECIGIVKSRSRGTAFKLRGALYSATRLAIEVIRETRIVADKEILGGTV